MIEKEKEINWFIATRGDKFALMANDGIIAVFTDVSSMELFKDKFKLEIIK